MARKREVTFDHLYRAALTGKIVPEDPRNVSSCDLCQRRVASLEHLATCFIERDVAADSSEFERQPSEVLPREVLKHSFDTLPFRETLRGRHDQPGDPLWLLAHLGVAHPVQKPVEKPVEVIRHARSLSGSRARMQTSA